MQPIKMNFATDEIPSVLNEFKNIYNKEITCADICMNDEYIKKLIEIMVRRNKNKPIRLTDTIKFLQIWPNKIKSKIKQLNLLNYFEDEVDYELKFENFLKENNIRYQRNNKLILKNQNNIDFYLPDYKIGFDINNVQIYRIEKKKSNYYINKTSQYKQKEIKLVHVWQWELEKPELWRRLNNWILDLLNTNKKIINIKNCNIRIVSLEEEKEFLNNYHLQGYQKSQICLGIYDNNDQLLQIMSFCKSRWNKNYQYELLRLCTKYGYFVENGAKKLLNYFIYKYYPESIISYCSLDKFTGGVYEKIGFKMLKRNQPSAIWYHEKTGRTFSDRSMVTLGADKLIGTNFGKGTDNDDIAYENDYKKIFNCGNSAYGMYIEYNDKIKNEKNKNTFNSIDDYLNYFN